MISRASGVSGRFSQTYVTKQDLFVSFALVHSAATGRNQKQILRYAALRSE
jgi:hypothetical protein